MEDRPIVRNVNYVHSFLEGNACEAGRQQGEWIKGFPDYARFFTSPDPEHGPFTPAQAEQALKFFERYCPGLNEEVQGFADVLEVPLQEVVYYSLSYARQGQCSQFVVLPGASADGHLRIGRSYEFSHNMTDLRLATTRIQGRAAHIGFSEVLFGRDDGLNEHGLCVSMTGGAPMAPVEPGGCMFWAVIRTVLDRCKSVDEAIELVQGMPISFNMHLLLADRSGQAAILEIASSHRAIRRIGPEAAEQFMLSTNHFTLPETLPYDLGRMPNSLVRARTIQKRLESAAPRITPETMRGLLSDLYPEGLCCHYFTDFFGTLWSEVFDITAGTVDVCFGPPTHNAWHTFNLNNPVEVSQYPVQLPDEIASEGMFRKLPPGAEE